MEVSKLDSVFKKLDNFNLFHLIAEKLDVSSNFFLLLSLISHSCARFGYSFLHGSTSKVEILQR